ncbi:MAG: 16S rRNA (cytosine(1402)-N(4))-methyltransferase RsmH [Bacteroidetes bacterium]|nr:MAG: 16S rRNA (cytosine(1402)-N(4))-methyltransferase RsmH [Bacteroidota bacterium]
MLSECIEALAINPAGLYVDLTFGGGGHAKVIAQHLTSGKLFVFDQDEDAHKNYEKLIIENPALGNKIILIKANFRYLKKFLRLHEVRQVDGILADLGVSSHQFDTAERGFSFRFDAKLDMRMGKTTSQTAKDIINSYQEKDLVHIFSNYGEITNSKTLAQSICNARAKNEITTTTELKNIASALAKRGQEHKYMAQLFQALRIEVNEELKALEEMLLQTAEVLKPAGRLVVMTYHSLEDRPVKNYIKQGLLFGEAEKDLFGNVEKPFESITRKPIEASEEEQRQNPRSRSAKLRVAERV